MNHTTKAQRINSRQDQIWEKSLALKAKADITKHTPGPWEAHDDDGTSTLLCVLSEKVNAGGNFYVAQCNVFEDARLISAAPEMLAALKLALLTIEHRDGLKDRLDLFTTDERNKLRQAIAKAEGI